MKIKHTNEKNRKLSKVDSLWKQFYIITLDLPKKKKKKKKITITLAEEICRTLTILYQPLNVFCKLSNDHSMLSFKKTHPMMH